MICFNKIFIIHNIFWENNKNNKTFKFLLMILKINKN